MRGDKSCDFVLISGIPWLLHVFCVVWRYTRRVKKMMKVMLRVLRFYELRLRCNTDKSPSPHVQNKSIHHQMSSQPLTWRSRYVDAGGQFVCDASDAGLKLPGAGIRESSVIWRPDLSSQLPNASEEEDWPTLTCSFRRVFQEGQEGPFFLSWQPNANALMAELCWVRRPIRVSITAVSLVQM